jgi:hypothetical protein
MKKREKRLVQACFLLLTCKSLKQLFNIKRINSMTIFLISNMTIYIYIVRIRNDQLTPRVTTRVVTPNLSL